MSAPENQPARAMTREQVIDLCDRSLTAYGARSHTDLTEDLTVALRSNAQQAELIYRLTARLAQAEVLLQSNTEDSLEEAVEVVATGRKQGCAFLVRSGVYPDLSEAPANVVLLAAHRIQVAAGRP